MRLSLLIAGAATAAALVGGAGLVLAQDQNATTDQTANVLAPSAPSAPADLDIPPPEEAPPPPPASRHAARDEDDSDDNAVANTVAAAPAAPVAPPRRPRSPVVVLQALDKVTAETLRFEAKVDEPVRYKDLVITAHACETQASDEPYAQTAAHLEVQYQPEVLGGRTSHVAHEVFQGWMYGDAPGVNPFEHPIYDLWVIACRMPSAPAAPAPAAGASR